ncbi:MAG: PilX N-terminal domain-containing pilus assembly protein [Gallionella sp.]|nr:PilX N-terminal domain-containing pilus assembly protein [Gallionella sp.]
MKNYPTHSLPHKQSGSTLIISLIILILLMLLGVTAMNTSDTQFQLAGNLQFEDSAMNNTETAINASETWLAASGVTNYNNAGFTTYNAGASPQLYPAAAVVDPLTMTWDNTTSSQVAGTDNQRYIIQQVTTNSRLAGSSQAVGGRTSTGCNQVNTYRVTGRGQSARGATKFVESYYSVLSCP